jgi:peptide subunit release factor RF-3
MDREVREPLEILEEIESVSRSTARRFRGPSAWESDFAAYSICSAIG